MYVGTAHRARLHTTTVHTELLSAVRGVGGRGEGGGGGIPVLVRLSLTSR